MWFRGCALGTAGFLGLHALYWLPPIPLPVRVTTLLGFVVLTELYVFFPFLVLATVLGPVVMLGGLVWLAWRRRRRAPAPDAADEPDHRGFLSPRLHSLAWLLIFFGHLYLDLNPYLTAVCGSGALLLFPWFWTGLGRVWRPLADRHAHLVSLAMGGAWWLWADDASVRVAVLVWVIVLFLAVRGPGRRLAGRDRVTLVLLCVPVVQMITVMLPAVIKMHDGRKIGMGMAYSFCEDEEDERLFAVVPNCTADEIEKCRKESTVDELDAATLELRAQHRFFSDRYAGRLEQLTCLGDRVEVGMDHTVVDGHRLAQNLLEFHPDHPEEFTANALEGDAGDGIAYDRRRRAVFYRSETHQLIRRDLASGRIDRNLVAASGRLAPTADVVFDEKRDRLLVVRNYGSAVELDPVTTVRRAAYPILNAWEATIDQDLDRLYVVGTWGMEVVDLLTGRVIRRARIGFGGRRPAIDRRNDLVYVPSTGGGRLHVFDRRSLALVGTIPLGPGPRYPYISESHGYLLSTSFFGYFAWNARALARRLRGDERGLR